MKLSKKVIAAVLCIVLVFSSVSVVAFASKTDDNTAEKATSLTVGTPVTESFTADDTVDWYCFSSENNATFSFTLAHESITGTDEFCKVEIFTADNTETPFAAVTSTLADASVSGEFNGVKNGNYYAKVSTAFDDAQGIDYTLTVTEKTVVTGDIESGINNSFTLADRITLKTLMNGKLSADGKGDYYYVIAGKDGILNVEFSHERQSGRTESYFNVKVYDASQNVVGSAISTGADGAVALDGIEVKEGKYNIVVTPGATTSDIPYQLYVSLDDIPTYNTEVEDNNLPSEASKIVIGRPTYGALSTTKDGKADTYDYYFVDVENAGVLDIKFNHDKSSADNAGSVFYRVDVLDGSQTVIDTVTSKGTDTSVSFTPVDVKAGRYYICVRVGDVACAEQYSLIVDAADFEGYEQESNDTVASADEIVPGTKQSAKLYYAALDKAEDVDCFKFELSDPGYILLKFAEESASDTNYKLEICTETTGSGEVTLDTIHAVVLDEDSSDYTTPSVGLDAGTYFIKVSCVAGDGGEYLYDGGAYSIAIVYVKYNQEEKEPNNTAENANEIPTNTGIIGSLFDANDADYYKISYDSSKKLNITLKAYSAVENENATWKVYVLPASGTSFKFTINCNKGGTYAIGVDKAKELNWKSGDIIIKICFEDGQPDNFASDDYVLTIGQNVDVDAYSFFERLQQIDWKNFWANFNFVKNFDFSAVIAAFKTLFQGIGAMFRALKGNG